MSENQVTFDTYKAFAQVVFDSGAYKHTPEGMDSEKWDERIATFAMLAFREDLLQRDVAQYVGVTPQAVQVRRVQTEAHLLQFIPDEAREIYTPVILQEAFPMRMSSLERRKSTVSKHNGSIALVINQMDEGKSYEEALSQLPKDQEVPVRVIRERVKKLGYTVSKTVNEKMNERRGEIENPDATIEDIQRYFSEMTKSYRDRLSLGPNPAIVSFSKTLKDMGIPRHLTNKVGLEFLEKLLFQKGIVVGNLPFIVRQKDGSYQHVGTYHYHRAIDTENLQNEKDYIDLWISAKPKIKSLAAMFAAEPEV